MRNSPATFLSLRLIHWLILLASVGLTILVWLITSYQTDKLNQAKFNREANHVISLIEERMGTYVDALNSGVAYIVASNNKIDHRSWRKFSKQLNIEKKYKGINGIGVIYVVPKKDKQNFLRKQRAEGNPLSIFPKHDEGLMLPITFIEPLAANKNALGLDVAHEKNRLAGARVASKTAKPTVTGPIVLVQDQKKTPGFLLYVPLYKNTADAKGKRIHGYVYAPFIVSKLMDGVLSQEKRYVHLRISDDGNLIFKDVKADEVNNDRGYYFSKFVNMYSREWKVEVWPTQRFLQTMDTQLPTYILIAGGIIDLSLLVLFLVLARSHTSAVNYGEKLTVKLKKMANDDYLTSLPNRMFFINAVEQAFESVNQNNIAVLYLDLDDFKNINDSLGHTFGDELLVQVAKRMLGLISSMDSNKVTLARIGGDEFAILLCDDNVEQFSQYVAKSIIHVLDGAFLIHAHELRINCSIGIATASLLITQKIDDNERVKALLKYADIAMYDAKGRGKNQYSLFDDYLCEKSERKSNIELQLHNTVSSEQIHMVYQPIYKSGSLELFAIESLVRWDSPVLGEIGPMEFIPIAEKTGFINKLGWKIFELVFLAMREWQLQGGTYAQCMVTINCSPQQLEEKHFISIFVSMMRKYSIDPNRIVLEITETALMHKIDEKILILEQLVKLGVGVAIDDFGTGYSSLNYLEQLPVNYLKIDQTFVSRIRSDHNDMIDNILKISSACHLKVIAEGVENEMQLRYLTQAGCDYLQGFYFNK